LIQAYRAFSININLFIQSSAIGRIHAGKKMLLILLLMAILPQSFLTLVRRNFMTLTLFTTRHT
ncbi:MAG TPA: hypothetical protein VGQ53_07920, partial [Chitinophagaceae bacterium]|nr:hypothetical protein [Chitinophagaceae bacterium]